MGLPSGSFLACNMGSEKRTLDGKLTSVEKALGSVRPGHRIFVGTACATPRTLIRALESPTTYLADVQIFHFLTDGAILTEGKDAWTRFQHKVFFVGSFVGEKQKEVVVGNSCYYVDPSTNTAEIAYMIHPEWQGSGLGTAMQQRLVEYGRSKGLKGFTASILAQNQKMLGLIKKSGFKVSIKMCSEVYEVTLLFEEPD